MMPLISFVITYHNEPKDFLMACLQSIRALPLRQGEAEIIVVDDGKTLSDFPLADAIHVPQEQAGLSVARNTGISFARGQYIQFIDADDSLIPSSYESVLNEVRRGESDIVLFKMSTVPSPPSLNGNASLSSRPPILDKRQSRPFPPPFEGTGEARSFPADSPSLGVSGGGFYLQHHNLRAAAWGYVFRKETLGDLRFFPGLLHEDELFTPQLFLRANTLVELNQRAYFYRQHAGTITSSKSAKQIHKRLEDIHFIIMELQSLANPLLERRIHQLTADYLQKVWTLTHSFSELRRRVRELCYEGFLPLPLRCYSLRYSLISLLSRLF